MKTILVDLGNTALKWAVLGNEHEPHTVVHRGAPESLHDLYEVWQCEAPDAVLGCTVAAPKLAFSATKFFNACDIPWQWVHSLPTFRCAQWELRNNYLHPELLGADRWCAAIGAIDSAPAEAILIVQLGTATTVDAVLRESERHYVFLGGRIAPGPTMMQQSLVNGTAALTSDIGLWQSEPRLTKDAIVWIPKPDWFDSHLKSLLNRYVILHLSESLSREDLLDLLKNVCGRSCLKWSCVTI